MQRREWYCYGKSSVRNVEVLWSHIGWNSSKIISRLVRFPQITSRIYHKGNTLDILAGIDRGGVSKRRLSAYKSYKITEMRKDSILVTIEDQ